MNNNKSKSLYNAQCNFDDFGENLKEGETVAVMVDRSSGTVGFRIHGKYKETFCDEEIKTGSLHFACSGCFGSVFEVD